MVHRNYHNGLKTTLLLGGMWALLVCIGALVAQGTGRAIWIVVFAGIGLAQTAYSYWNSASIALRSMNAYPVSELEQPELYAIVRELSERAGQPMPLIWVAPTMTPNAFATGRNPGNAAVCCTEGILEILNERELRGVLGHELMHVYNRDILTSSVAAAMAGVIHVGRAVPDVFRRGKQARRAWGSGRPRPHRDEPARADRLDAHPALAVAYPGVRCRRGWGPAHRGSARPGVRAAQAGDDADRRPMAETPRTRNVAAMMIANPFRGGSLGRLFSTHPPMEQRIARLEQIAGY